MTRSSKKGPYVDPNLEDKILKMNSRNEKRLIKSWARSSTLTPDMEVVIVTSAKNDEEGRRLLQLMGMPFRRG